MAKALTIAAMAISLILLVIFGLDLVVKFPFGGMKPILNIVFVVLSGILGYLSWSTWRELT
ncbi:MAG: hypothetical protein JW719_07685 [Pirellulales bacterium]|nr:hypothetical protein [Pirellulales bacterium]